MIHTQHTTYQYLNFFRQAIVGTFRLGAFNLNRIEQADCISDFQEFFPNNELIEKDAFLLILCLLPNLSPDFLDQSFNELFGDGNHPQLGGVRGKQHRGILPTAEMALYLMSGENMELRQQLYQEYFTSKHWLFTENILYLEPPLPGEPQLSGKLLMAPEYIELFMTGTLGKPSFGINFPAQHITTKQDWDDLVLHANTMHQVEDLKAWITHGDSLLKDWGLQKRVKPGYRALFYGPSGTGKTLTASLLGKTSGCDVYRVDLSMVVSKYIGETEKNLSKLFDKAEHKGWILFFDEADALFGKRTGVRDAHDRYANQEVSYLLQRVEDYDGLVILASNFKDNIDDAFLRRFQSIIHFPLPRPHDRLRLWQQSFPEAISLTTDVDLKALANRYELTGADIVNVVHYCSLCARAEERNQMTQNHIITGIQRELRKLGKSLK